ncbi:hypothetical protein C8E83_0886 [Frondihabitans australicus]|uniref:DUF2993 family protein n=1 Tax=Frondihabitans australicus TaxID=386892 RepID=A0A495ICZ1_9MICO|nr:hypothetical protein C8E83_0886 [Frondihabitans australicus]
MTILVIVLVVLAALCVAAELVARHVAEAEAEKQIDSSLPAGTTGTVGVKIHGFSVILQALSGHLDDVSLASHDLVVQKIPLTFDATVTDVPLKQGGTTGPIDATVVIDQKALNDSKLLQNASGNIALGSGTFSYDSSINILGLQLQYKLTAKPSVTSNGKSVVLTPTNAAISSSNSSIDVSSLLQYLKTQPPTICVASSLPTSATLTGIGVTPGVATFHLHSTGLPLDSAALSEKGTC